MIQRRKKPRRFTCTLLALIRKSLIINGAGEGNRTLVSGLGSPHSTIEPHPHPGRLLGFLSLLTSICNLFQPELFQVSNDCRTASRHSPDRIWRINVGWRDRSAARNSVLMDH